MIHPRFEGDMARQAALLNVALWIVIVLTAVVTSFTIRQQGYVGSVGFSGLFVVILGLLGLRALRGDHVLVTARVFVGGVWLIVSLRCLITGGVSSPVVVAYFPITLLACVAMSARDGLIAAVGSAAMLLVMWGLEARGALPEVVFVYPGWMVWLIQAAGLVMTMGLAYMAIVLLDEGLKQAREAEARFAELVHSAPEGVVALDEEGRIASLNPAAERIFDDGENALIGLPFATSSSIWRPPRRCALIRANCRRSWSTSWSMGAMR